MTKPNEAANIPIDAGFLEQAFRDYYSWLCAAAWEILEDEEMAKDIVHDFFLYCYNKKPVLEKVSYFRKYAFTAVKNASLSFKRRSKKIAFQDPATLGKYLYADDEQVDANDVVSRETALWELIGSLPDERRRIFLLSNRDGLKYTEIAEQLNISINTVKTQIRLAYQFLRKECSWLITAAQMIIIIF